MSTDHPQPTFASRLVAWQKTHGRHDLPWQGTHDPYRVWLSEIMLQQTQVKTVIAYYQRFLERFPDIASLAAASEDDVMAHWAGLGYYSRARHLHQTARRVCGEHAGHFPRDPAALEALPGIGRSTAAAIASFAFGQRRAILDGNVKRVLARVFGIEGWPGEKAVEDRLWTLAESLLPEADIPAYTQGLMDLGATRCTRHRPVCGECPCADDCHARLHGRQDTLPGARPRKAMPEKSTVMLILYREGAVLLEKRPSPGIWGGLWSLPECALETAPETAARRLGCLTNQVQRLEVIRHAFTHYRLRIHPCLMRVSIASRVEVPERAWHPIACSDTLPLPTPVRRLLTRIGQHG